ncbi:MAG: hypothetical protein SGPRY_009725 [Prymnesium sp.]
MKAELCASSVANFGFALFALLEEPGKDVLLISPYSIGAALSLAAAGYAVQALPAHRVERHATAGGAAERELLQALGAPTHSHFANVATAMLKGDAAHPVELQLANSVWVKQGVLPAYEELVREVHSAEAQRLGESYHDLNAWVASKTDGRIPRLIEDEKVDSLVQAVLVNAVFFKGTWAVAFNPALTQDGEFSSPAGPVPARFMWDAFLRLGGVDIGLLGGAAVVQLDYGSSELPESEFCALMVLPEEASPASMAAAIEGLKQTSAQRVLAQLEMNADVKVRIPRFRAEAQVELVDYFRNLGINQLSNDPEVHIDQVVHKAAMEVGIPFS